MNKKVLLVLVAVAVFFVIGYFMWPQDAASHQLLHPTTKYAVWAFAFIIALGQLGVAQYYMSVLFTGIIAMLSLGGALAFGLGGRDAAARFIERLGSEMSHRE